MFIRRDGRHAIIDGDNALINAKRPATTSCRVPLLVYTHSDYFDVFRVFVGEFNRYLSGSFDLSIACNKGGRDGALGLCKKVNQSIYQIVTYDDSNAYTDRLIEILTNIANWRRILLLHEDMVPIGKVNDETIRRLVEFSNINNLCWLGITKNTTYQDKKRISNFISSASTGYRYVVQPAIIDPAQWIQKLKSLPRPFSIWEFEEYMRNLPDKVYFLDNSKDIKRGGAHFDASDFPHISTAIVKGKWNVSEYPVEIGRLSSRYGLALSKRGLC